MGYSIDALKNFRSPYDECVRGRELALGGGPGGSRGGGLTEEGSAPQTSAISSVSSVSSDDGGVHAQRIRRECRGLTASDLLRELVRWKGWLDRPQVRSELRPMREVHATRLTPPPNPLGTPASPPPPLPLPNPPPPHHPYPPTPPHRPLSPHHPAQPRPTRLPPP